MVNMDSTVVVGAVEGGTSRTEEGAAMETMEDTEEAAGEDGEAMVGTEGVEGGTEGVEGLSSMAVALTEEEGEGEVSVEL